MVSDIPNSVPVAIEDHEELSSSSEGVLVINIPEDEESKHSYYSGSASDTLDYVPDISDISG